MSLRPQLGSYVPHFSSIFTPIKAVSVRSIAEFNDYVVSFRRKVKEHYDIYWSEQAYIDGILPKPLDVLQNVYPRHYPMSAIIYRE